jgi:branched-chain amino acid transport system substrate-binding protein
MTFFNYSVAMNRFLILFFIVYSFSAHAQLNIKPETNPVKIGFLIPDKKAVAAKNGAELAILQANNNGGYHGRTFELVVRSMEGPWGTGAKEAVKMIFEDKVSAIIGSVDGRNAHLVEQVATKSHVVFLSAWSGDPTLSQAFVPWFFTCVANNNQQANALFDEIYLKKNMNQVGIVSDLDYDSQSALKSFLKKPALAGKPEPLRFNLQEHDLKATAGQLLKANLQAVVLFVKPAAAWKLAAELTGNRNKLQVYGFTMVLNENELSVQKMNSTEGQPTVCSGNWHNARQQAFSKDYQKKNGDLPGAVAAFSFDGMNLLIEAIRKGGLERENIQKALFEIQFSGVTGPMQFDQKGNRIGSVRVVSVKNGIPELEK